MSPTLPPLGRDLLLVAVYNTVIALFLTALTRYDLVTNLIYSQCIGLAIYVGVHASSRFRRQTGFDWLDGALGIPAGLALGFVLGTWINGLTLMEVLTTHPGSLLIAGTTALVFGALGTWHFHDQARLLEARDEIRTERLRRTEQEALAARSELARLQAQIEPHFLFNTLSNVVGLIDTDPPAARSMLLDLTALLRTSLARTRRADVTLGEEIELLRAYLGIMAVRMGERLRWRIDADADALASLMPPLLVQPLVENAIRHGLEPKPEGGSLNIRCRRDQERIEIEVEDSGRGLQTMETEGVGLSNVRERLRACYGDAARLELETNADGGLTARLRLPASPHAPADR
jgi:hypothetical protein